MVSITVTGSIVDVRFTGWEALWTGQRRLAVPVAGVRQASVVGDPLRLARGGRRGITVSGFLKIGVWGVFGGPRRLVVARRGGSAVHLVLDRWSTGGRFDEVVLSDPAAATIVGEIAGAMAARA